MKVTWTKYDTMISTAQESDLFSSQKQFSNPVSFFYIFNQKYFEYK